MCTGHSEAQVILTQACHMMSLVNVCLCREVIDGIAEVCYIAGPLLFFDLLMVRCDCFSVLVHPHVRVYTSSA